MNERDIILFRQRWSREVVLWEMGVNCSINDLEYYDDWLQKWI